MKRILLPGLLAAAACMAVASPDDEIKAADKAWAAAVKSKDLAALDKMFLPGLVYAHATGPIESKEVYINRLKEGKQRYDSVTIESTRVFPYGDSALSHSIVRVTGINSAGPFNDHVMMMHMWVKQGGMWRLAGHQTTKVP